MKIQFPTIHPIMSFFIHEKKQIDFPDSIVLRTASPVMTEQSVINLEDGLPPEKNESNENKKDVAVQVDADIEEEVESIDDDARPMLFLLFLFDAMCITIILMLYMI